MADGVRLESAYIELGVDGSGVVDGIKKSLADAGTHAKTAGKKMGKELSSEVGGALKDVGKGAFDGLKKEAESAGKVASKRLSDSFGQVDRKIKGTTELVSTMGKRFESSLQTLQTVGTQANTALGNLNTSAQSTIDHLGSIGTSLGKLKAGDVAGGLKDISGALDAIGQSGAAGVLADIGTKAGEFQDKTAGLKDNIQGTTTQLLTLTNNSGRIAGGLTAIAGAAGPLAATFAALATINPASFKALGSIFDQLQGKKDFNAKDWFNALVPGTTYIDQGVNGLKNFFNPTGNQPRFGAGIGPGGGSGLQGMLQNLQAFGGGGAGSGGIGSGFGASGASSPLSPSSGADSNPFGAIDPQRAFGRGAGPAARSTLGNAGTGSAIVPAGTYTGPGAGGAFPQWVNDIGARFSIKPSTYSGHQTTNRAEAGFAPNPQNFNRGIDWGGPGTSVESMQRFAEFALAHPELFEQVIWSNPKTGQKVGIAGGKVVGDGYYANDYGGHTDHVHTRFAQGFSLANIPSFDKGTDGPLPEDTLAQLHKGEIVVPKDQVDAAADAPDAPGLPDAGARTAGFMPAAAMANAGGVAGTSSLSGLFDLGNQAAAGLIDTGASAAAMAASMGSMGAGGQAAGLGIEMGASLAKRGVSYAFQAGSILADAAVEQLFPFGAPRWIGYDYTSFMPQLNISQIGVTTGEKAAQSAMANAGTGGVGAPDTSIGQMPGGPVNPMTLAGSQPVGAPVQSYSERPAQQAPTAAPGTGPSGSSTPAPLPGLDVMSTPPSIAPFTPSSITSGGATGLGDFLGLPPILGRDEGGWVPDGAMAYNTSGRPELVLSGAQLDQMTTRPAVNQGGSGATYNITVADFDDAMRKLKAKERSDARRYTGRF